MNNKFKGFGFHKWNLPITATTEDRPSERERAEKSEKADKVEKSDKIEKLEKLEKLRESVGQKQDNVETKD